MEKKKVRIGLHQHKTCCFMFNVSYFQKRNSPWQTSIFKQINTQKISKQPEIAQKFMESAHTHKKQDLFDCVVSRLWAPVVVYEKIWNCKWEWYLLNFKLKNVRSLTKCNSSELTFTQCTPRGFRCGECFRYTSFRRRRNLANVVEFCLRETKLLL